MTNEQTSGIAIDGPPIRPVLVSITVEIDGEEQTFSADAATAADVHYVANGLLVGLTDDASHWVLAEGRRLRG